MLVDFFLHLKSFRLPVSTREFLTLLEALDERVVSLSIDDFHTLARTCLVKDEQHFDRFDLAFGSYFKNVDAIFDRVFNRSAELVAASAVGKRA
jgi:uncharacterized protein with von Willebrand factor type A (vWA) domain